MGEIIECKVCTVDFDDLGKVNEAIQDFANNKLKCEIKGNTIGSISKLTIEKQYSTWAKNKDRIVVKALISLWR